MNTRELNHELLYTLISAPVDVNRVRQLLEAGANPDEGIFLAKDTGNPEIMKALIDAGVDENCSNSSRARKNTGEIIDELYDVLTSPPINVERVRQLINAGAYPDECFFEAILTGKLEVVKIFVEAGADVNSFDDDFETPLLSAKNAVLRLEKGEYDEAVDPEYDEIVAYLEELTTQETKDIVKEIMRQNNT
jgi:ankyrin repeat protein